MAQTPEWVRRIALFLVGAAVLYLFAYTGILTLITGKFEIASLNP
jgi:hypothetical protein